MKQVVTILTLVSAFILFSFPLYANDSFDRAAVIPLEPDDIGGIGHLVAGVDFDNDGRAEIYAVNTDWYDVPGQDLVPRIYKYERNDDGQWEIVWWTRLSFDFQNTWSAMAASDLDNDGKMEITYGPVNNFGGGLNPNPSRIVVFETVGDGSDVMGIDNGDGTYSPNAEWTIVDQDNVNLRPFRWHITDIDGDGTDEIVSSIRAGDAGLQIYSTDDVPDAGDGSETWTMEFSGLTGTYWDIAILDSTAYGLRDNGDVTGVTWSASGDSFRVGETQEGLVPGGSWKSSSTLDIDDDGTEEIVVGGWINSDFNQVWVLQRADDDTLTASQIADLPDAAGRINGGDYGDIDGDGNVDIVFGSRVSDPLGQIHRLEYQGGDITDGANYVYTVIDMGVSDAQQYDVVDVANVDGDSEDEVVYGGIPRGLSSSDPPQPIVVLDKIAGNQPVITSVQDVPNDNGRQVTVVWDGAADDVGGMRFTANLSGDNEVGPVSTVASGKATFTLDEENNTLSYLLEVNNIDSVAQAHIHQGPPDENGSVGAFLFGPATPGGPFNGILASGTITVDDLVGPWAGDWDGFVNDLLNGNTYANVHTATNPGGEIRGQILTDPISKARAQRSNELAGFTISHYVVWRIDDGLPVQVQEVVAIQADQYAAVVPTLADGDTTSSTFVVTAHTPIPTVLWKSFPKSGFSLDNLAPSAPTSLTAVEAESGAQLTWDESPDPDFNFFTVVKGTEAGFDPESAEVVGFTTETSFTDTDISVGETFYYRVRATDFSDNAGAFSNEASVLITSIADGPSSAVPTEFALQQNYPNPFNPETQISYDLPDAVDVSLKIYNLRGQEVKTLVNENQPAGTHTILWDGTNNFGAKVASGIYMYVIKAGEFVQTKRMTLLK